MRDPYEVLQQKEYELNECREDLSALCRVAKLLMAREKDAREEMPQERVEYL